LSALRSLNAATQKENTAAVHTNPTALVTKEVTVCQLDVPLPSSGPLSPMPCHFVIEVPMIFDFQFFLAKRIVLPVPLAKVNALFGVGEDLGVPLRLHFFDGV
jgi:hypothetical protein